MKLDLPVYAVDTILTTLHAQAASIQNTVQLIQQQALAIEKEANEPKTGGATRAEPPPSDGLGFPAARD